MGHTPYYMTHHAYDPCNESFEKAACWGQVLNHNKVDCIYSIIYRPTLSFLTNQIVQVEKWIINVVFCQINKIKPKMSLITTIRWNIVTCLLYNNTIKSLSFLSHFGYCLSSPSNNTWYTLWKDETTPRPFRAVAHNAASASGNHSSQRQHEIAPHITGNTVTIQAQQKICTISQIFMRNVKENRKCKICLIYYPQQVQVYHDNLIVIVVVWFLCVCQSKSIT